MSPRRALDPTAEQALLAAAWTPPCGGCRQKLREFAGDDLPVLVADMAQVQARFSLGELLPQAFGPNPLKPR